MKIQGDHQGIQNEQGAQGWNDHENGKRGASNPDPNSRDRQADGNNPSSDPFNPKGTSDGNAENKKASSPSSGKSGKSAHDPLNKIKDQLDPRNQLRSKLGLPRHASDPNKKKNPGLADRAKDAAKTGAANLGKKAAKKALPHAAAGAAGYVGASKLVGAVTGLLKGFLDSAPVTVITQIASAVTHGVNAVLSTVTTALGFKAVTSAIPTVVLTVGVTTGAVAGTVATLHTGADGGNNCRLMQNARNGLITSEMRDKIISLAKTQLGVPYVWGGTKWDKGMDCSGFVQQVFSRVGINLPRTAAQQSTVAKTISQDDAKPGDLVFWGDKGSSHHVAIYLGKGQIIAEPQTGESTKIQPVWGNPWFGALDMVTASDGSINSSVGGAAVGAYTQSGTEGYNNAKALFNELVKTHGFSGAGAAGAVGNAARESSFNPKADNASGGVHGIFQWSGWANTVNGNRWSRAPGGKVDTFQNELGLMNVELSSSHAKAKKSVGSATDPVQAAGLWAEYYEGLKGGATNAQYNASVTNSATNWAYREFGGQDIQANDSLLGSTPTDIANGNAGVAAGAQGNDFCKTFQSESDPAAGKASPLDGQGSVSESPGTYWEASHLPKDVKKYVHDPKQAKLSYGSSSGWSNPGGSDTHFALSYFRALWGAPNVSIKNGASAAGDVAKAISGDKKNTSSSPKAGAIGSFPANVKGYSGKNGHAFIVEHVLENGNIIIAEQNVKGYSGSANGTPNTWNYRLVSEETYSKAKATFFSSEGANYSLNWTKE